MTPVSAQQIPPMTQLEYNPNQQQPPSHSQMGYLQAAPNAHEDLKRKYSELEKKLQKLQELLTIEPKKAVAPPIDLLDDTPLPTPTPPPLPDTTEKPESSPPVPIEVVLLAMKPSAPPRKPSPPRTPSPLRTLPTPKPYHMPKPAPAPQSARYPTAHTLPPYQIPPQSYHPTMQYPPQPLRPSPTPIFMQPHTVLYAQPYYQPHYQPQHLFPNHPPSQQTVNTASDLAMAIKAATQFSLLKLTKSVAKDGAQFEFWKKKVILTVSNDVALSNIIVPNALESDTFDSSAMAQTQSKQLFHGLFDSFDTDIHQQINLTTSATTNMNSPQLWKELVSSYSNKALTFRTREKLIHNYKNFKPQKGESLDAIFF